MNKKISVKKIIITVLIVSILAHFYYSTFGIGYARKEYKFNRSDVRTWLNNLPEYKDFKINTSQEDFWNEDHTEKEYFNVKIPGFYRDTLFDYRLDYIDIPPIKFNDIFNYKIKEKFPCTVVIKYALDDEEPLTESYDFIVEVEKGHWWNPNNPWMLLFYGMGYGIGKLFNV